MKVLLLALGAFAVYESVIDLLFQIKELDRKTEKDFDDRLENYENYIVELTKGISAIEINALDSTGNSELRIGQIQEDLNSASFFIESANNNLVHDSEQLKQIKSKKCFENNGFIDEMIILKETEVKVSELKEEFNNFFEGNDSVFLEKVMEVVENLGSHSTAVLAQYGLYTHPYEFSTEERNKIDEERTKKALEYANEKKLKNLDSDLQMILENLQEFIEDSLKKLEEREIKTAHDIVQWEMELQKESAQLLDEIERKKMQIQKMDRDIERLNAYNNINQEIWKLSKNTRNTIEETYNNFVDYEKNESSRRKHTDEAVEEALYVFETQFPEYSEYIQSKTNI